MQKWVNIIDTGVGVDVKQLKKIVIEEWQSGKLYRFHHNRGRRGKDLQDCILTELMILAEPIQEAIHEEAIRRSGYSDAATNWIDKYPRSDIRSIGFEVLEKLLSACSDWRFFENLTTDDIPAILEFLDTPPDKALEAWEKWDKYWASLDYPARRRKLLENVE